MSRRPRTQASVSLFPFLAVLICTMGSLIVLLVVVAQQARNTVPMAAVPVAPPVATVTPKPPPAPAPPPPPPVASEESLRQLEDLRWANELLAQSREDTLADLEKRRIDLSRIEDQARSLSQQLEQLEIQAQQLLAAEADRLNPEEAKPSDLEDLKRQIAETKTALESKQTEASQQRKEYAIVPYAGANGTRRRPIYIECKSDAVVLQPEGIHFRASDFKTTGANSPLAAALRAYREYLSNAMLLKPGEEPYPLIVVRPGGEKAYSACRNALRAWDDEFGYELVPEDMKLAFPTKDDGLAAFLENAVVQARNDLGRERQQFAMARHAAGVHAQGGGVGRGANGGQGSAGRNGNAGVSSRAGSPALGDPRGQGGAGNPSALSRDLMLDEPEAPTYALGRGIGGGLVPTTPGGELPTPNQPESGSLRDELVNGAASGTNSVGNPQNSGPPILIDPNGSSVGNTGGNSGGSPGGIARGAAGAVAANPNNNQNNNPSAESNGLTAATVTSAEGSNNASPSAAAAAGGAADEFGEGGAATASFSSLAETQGANWALPNAANGAIGVSRPITGVCEANRFVLRSDKGDIVVPIENGQVANAVQPLVTKVWGIIEGWGMAGQGVYWKPSIHLRVTPGSEAAYQQLVGMLKNSGLDVQQRK